MPNRLLISDANILIDMDVGGLVDAMFKLPYEYGTPNLLFEEELRLHHEDFLKKGLRLFNLEQDAVNRVIALGQEYTGVSSNDLAALALAEQEQAPLLTGDRKLYKVCIKENIEVHGTLWLVEQTFAAGHVTIDEVQQAYQKMETDGSRLPQDEIEKQIKRFKKK